MAKIWIISDTHFGHANIIRYCTRPFESVGQMNAAMVERWNACVAPQDHIYHLGDVAVSQGVLHQIMPQLQGHKRLILGNHDNHAPIADYGRYFKKVLAWRIFHPVVLTHMPLHAGSFGKAKVNVHGHIHENPSPTGPYINACVEWQDYRPRELDEIIEEAKRLL